MPDDLRRRLYQLGITYGVRGLTEPTGGPNQSIEELVPGHYVTTALGQCFVAETTYDTGHLHGSFPLSSLLSLDLTLLAHMGQMASFSQVDVQRVGFLDTETTGLSGGTGTMAFVVGIGRFAGERFVVQQYFLRDPGDEAAMIEALGEVLGKLEALVSFNGQAFDIPILENRFILARVPPPIRRLRHLDLLHSSRRLWRYALPSCTLGTIEQQVLGVHREQADVPGGVIPYLYRDYLRTGDAREMKRVLYHNAIDVVSLVTLTSRICQVVSDPASAAGVAGAELYGLGRWYESQGLKPRAELAFAAALERPMTQQLRGAALRSLAFLMKRSGRRAAAFSYWQQMVLETPQDILPYVELAKYFEWHVRDYTMAAEWAGFALARVDAWGKSPRRAAARRALQHRLARLERKTQRDKS
jgi:uncharacterized protein YprB with RNaseH-like and TPR domain